MPSIYELKDQYRRLRRHLPVSDAFARRAYHLYIDLLLVRTAGATFRDENGILFHLDRSNLLERQMAAAGFWEEDTKALIDDYVQPGATVVEVGANFGAHTLPLARKVGPHGRVIAFEPMDYAYDRLIANMRLNPGLRNISTHKCYVGAAAEDDVEVTITSRWSVDGRGNDTQVSRFSATPLDSMTAEVGRVDVLKIDVDGADHNVLKGARELIEAFRPIIYVEVSEALSNFGSSPRVLCNDMEGRGYELKVYDSRVARYVKFNAEAIGQVLAKKAVSNVLALSALQRDAEAEQR